MVLKMPSPVKDRNGTYYVIRRVPADIVPFEGKKIVKESLRTKNAAEAKKRFVEVISRIDARWANFRAGETSLSERQAHTLALDMYDFCIREWRDEPTYRHIWQEDLYPQLWKESTRDPWEPVTTPSGEQIIVLSDVQVWGMRDLCNELADDALRMHGLKVDGISRQKLVKAIGAAAQRAHVDLALMSEGHDIPDRNGDSFYLQNLKGNDASGSDQNIEEITVQSYQRKNSSKLLVSSLLADWWGEAKRAGTKPSTYESYSSTIKNFIKFIKTDDARKVTPEQVVAFKNYRLKTPSPKTGKPPSAKTVKDSDLSALKTIFKWAVDNHKLLKNPAVGVTIKLGKPLKVRSKGFSDEEALAILRASLNYKNVRENAGTSAAKKWVPWLCALTGARVGEIAQLRREDIRKNSQSWVIRITPEAGPQKTNEARDIVLHRQLVELGFPSFVETSGHGPLFLTPASNGDIIGPLNGLKNRLREFVRETVSDPNVAPNHGWRHRFKTVGREVQIESRVLDAIQGHAPTSVSESYGDVTLKTIAAEMDKIPNIDI